MIKYVKKSLSLKIFLLTTLLMMGIAAATYAFIAAFMPVTYSNTLNRELKEQVKGLTEKMSDVSWLDAFEVFEDFSRTYQADILLLDDRGNVVYTISRPVFGYETQNSEVYTDTKETAFDDTTWETDAFAEEDGTDEANDTQNDRERVEEETPAAESYDFLEDGSAYTINQDTGENLYLAQTLEQKGMERFPVKFKNETEEYTLVVGGSTQKVNQAMEALVEVLPLLLLVILAVSVLISVFYSRYLTRPVVRLSKVSRQMADLDFSVKCQENRPDEIGILSESLDHLSKKLDRTLRELNEANCQLKNDMEKEREQERKRMAFFAAASHELKTPVTILKGQLEGMIQGVGSYKDRDKYLVRSKEVTESMEETVQEILTISRMETDGFAISLEQTDLSEIIRRQLADLNELFENKHMHMEINLPDKMLWMADASMMAKVVRNLLVNAVRYSPENARICVGLQKEGDFAVFRAENSGVWIPKEQLPKIFEAFYRVDTSRNRKSGGSGLGLYIVREILELHHAQYQMENTASGVQFTFQLPKREPEGSPQPEDLSTKNT